MRGRPLLSTSTTMLHVLVYFEGIVSEELNVFKRQGSSQRKPLIEMGAI